MGYGIVGSIGGFLLALFLLLLLAGAITALLNKSGYGFQRSNERIVKIESDIQEIKKTVEDIKSKLEEI